MSNSIAAILAEHTVTEAQVQALIAQFDANGDGRLEGAEVKAFAKAVAAHLDNDIEDVLALLSFYQHDDDPALDPAEIRSFLDLYLS